jgi:VPDSG-CTERM motif
MKTSRFTKFALALSLAVGLSQSAQAVPILFNGHYYEIITAPGISWADANTAANAASYLGLGGHLVTITSAAEDAFVSGLIDTAGEHWAGGFQDPGETTAGAGWQWVNGEGAFSYTNWAGGEPNDAYGAGSEQHLGVGYFGAGSGWNDEGALANLRGYVIEYEASSVPDSGTSAALLGFAMLGLWGAQRLSFRRGAANLG